MVHLRSSKLLQIRLFNCDVIIPSCYVMIPRRKVVVTGLGLCTPLGCGVDLVWRRLLLGHSGIQSLPKKPEFKDLPSQVAGFVPTISTGSSTTQPGELDPYRYVDKSDSKMMSLDSVFAMAAATDALTDARWLPSQRPEGGDLVTGVAVGNAGTSSIMDYISINESIQSGRYRRISPYLIPRLLPNMAAGHISIKHKLMGPNHCVSTACASGLHSIGDAAHMIARGACDVMVAGSTDASLNHVIMAGFCRAKALSTKFNSEPHRASRPFDTKRDGFVPSEGAGVVILEELEHAKERGAPIYAEITGYGMSSDAHHITAPPVDSHGAVRAMMAALKDANTSPETVGHMNAHATSTPLGDTMENNALKQVFGMQVNDVIVYAPKGPLGHLLGAAGTVEAIVTVLSVSKGLVPPNLNLEERGEGFDLNYVSGGGHVEWPRKCGLPRVAMKNSFGFGGTNASICVQEYVEDRV